MYQNTNHLGQNQYCVSAKTKRKKSDQASKSFDFVDAPVAESKQQFNFMEHQKCSSDLSRSIICARANNVIYPHSENKHNSGQISSKDRTLEDILAKFQNKSPKSEFIMHQQVSPSNKKFLYSRGYGSTTNIKR